MLTVIAADSQLGNA